MDTLTVMKKILQACTVSIVLTACGSQEPAITQADKEPIVITAGQSQAAQKPATVTTGQTQDVAPEAETEETAQQDNAARAAAALYQIPYYGNQEICTLSAEQALAYAQLLADGMAGKAAMTAEGDFPIMDEYIKDSVVFWDLPFTVQGYSGPYETTRSRAILADLAGDGNPYLITYDPEKVTSSCTIWGWANDDVQLIANSENWMGRYSIYLRTDDQTGVVSLENVGSTLMMEDHTTYSFGNGRTTLAHTWQKEYRPDTDQIVVTEDGVSTFYTQEAYQAMLEAQPPVEAPANEYEWPTLEEELADGLPLAELLESLNHYAASIDKDTQPVANPVTTDEQKMARAMLQTISRQEVDTETGEAQLVYARLFDMDVDGTPELLLGNIDGFHDVKLYHWDHGGLSEISSAIGDDGGILADDFYLIQNPQNGTYGIQAVQYTDRLAARYTFVDEAKKVLGPIYVPYAMTEEEYAAAQAEYDNAAAQYRMVECIYDSATHQNTNTVTYLEETKATLSQMLESNQ